MNSQPVRERIAFGDRYWLTERLAVGGMAEIYLARQNAMAGFEKEVVIKRLKPELARDSRIVEMFLDEARIGAVLNHPNIVHVYDVDEHDGLPYIAMEYIRGEELNQLCKRGLQLGNFLPLQHAVELVRQAGWGMGYFHAQRDDRGGTLDIVHCDISPNNLLVTEDGFLKIIDFGIARAANQRFREAAAIPGKLSYMAPEQARRDTTDHRADIFSLGVVLYEITVGRRLFRGPAGDVVKRLVECDIKPPTFVRRDFPGALESVIMRALEKHPDDRYQSAYDLADDLEDFLRESDLRSAPVRIARYLDELATAAGAERRPELIAESERAKDDDALDFDRGMFDSYEASSASASSTEVSDWDEVEESDSEVAAALGIDPSMLDPATRTPIPVLASEHSAEPAGSSDAAEIHDTPPERDDIEDPEGSDEPLGADAIAVARASADSPEPPSPRMSEKLAGPDSSASVELSNRSKESEPATSSNIANIAKGSKSSKKSKTSGTSEQSETPESSAARDNVSSTKERNATRAQTAKKGGSADQAGTAIARGATGQKVADAADGLPWIPIGAGFAAAIAGILYILFS